MQEFESISASSYDPSALATKLTAKAAEGWSVVAIVPTGGDVTAYLSREHDRADAEPTNDVDAVVETEAVAVEAFAPESRTEPDAMRIEPTPEVSEPSGWAIAPEPVTPTPEPAAQPAAAEPISPYQPTISPAAVTHTPASPGTPTMGPSAASPAAAAPAAARPAEPAAAPAVPAGWYADPAGRFELRYWDGSTWTEHVSRTGQQFTDPPVA